MDFGSATVSLKSNNLVMRRLQLLILRCSIVPAVPFRRHEGSSKSPETAITDLTPSPSKETNIWPLPTVANSIHDHGLVCVNLNFEHV